MYATNDCSSQGNRRPSHCSATPVMTQVCDHAHQAPDEFCAFTCAIVSSKDATVSVWRFCGTTSDCLSLCTCMAVWCAWRMCAIACPEHQLLREHPPLNACPVQAAVPELCLFCVRNAAFHCVLFIQFDCLYRSQNSTWTHVCSTAVLFVRS